VVVRSRHFRWTVRGGVGFARRTPAGSTVPTVESGGHPGTLSRTQVGSKPAKPPYANQIVAGIE